MMNIDNTIAQLKCYNGPFKLTLHPGASEALIRDAENYHGITLPDDIKTLYRFSDGFEIDEDMLNMIPLGEMISHRNDKRIWIAEYMIYCDMWELEINPAKSGDYSICIGDRDKGKVILTNSLAEFIERMLKGAVFEEGGLYQWQGEIKAKLFGNTKPEEMKPLLAVLSECLKLKLISMKEVIQRASWIISTEQEPDAFFTRISLSRNLNELLTVLNSISLPDDIIQVRAVLGAVYSQFLINKMKAAKAVSILDKFADREELTCYETNEMRYLIHEWRRLYTRLNKAARIKLSDRIKAFFENYRDFNLYHYTNWNDINSKIVKEFSSKN